MLYIFVKNSTDLYALYLEICISLFFIFFLQDTLPYPFIHNSTKNSQLSRESHIFHQPVFYTEYAILVNPNIKASLLQMGTKKIEIGAYFYLLYHQ